MTPAIFGLSGPQLTDDERAFFRAADPAGYILFARNCVDRDQLRALTDALRTLHGRDRLLISIDQEGGRVQRMKPPVWRAWPAGEMFARCYAAAPASAIAAIRANGRALGAELARMGITVDYHAPLDVRRAETDGVIGDRALGDAPMPVAALGRALIEGLADAGVAGCLKHMPGHGRATADSHKELPVVTASAGQLATDIAPFARLAQTARIGMSAHIVYTAWDAERPATQSPIVVEQIIREAIGFDGLLLTDDLDMEALSGAIPDRAERALDAGCDLALNCWANIADMEGIAERLPAIGERASHRLERALESTGTKSDIDIEFEIARRDALLAAARVPA